MTFGVLHVSGVKPAIIRTSVYNVLITAWGSLYNSNFACRSLTFLAGADFGKLVSNADDINPRFSYLAMSRVASQMKGMLKVLGYEGALIFGQPKLAKSISKTLTVDAAG